MRLKRFNIRGLKIAWGPYIAILRETFGVGILDIKGKYVVKGGLTCFKDIAWSNKMLGAISSRKLLIIDVEKGIEKSEESVVRLEGGRSVLGTEKGFIVGTEDGRLLFIEGKKITNEVRIAEDMPITRLERTKSGAVLAVAGKYTLIIVSPNGEVLAHQSYRWELERVRWTPDLSWLIILGDKSVEFMKYEEGQGYVKVYEIEEPGVDARWCGEMLCIATKFRTLIYKRFEVGARPWLVITSRCKACAWAPECKGLAMLGDMLTLLLF